MRVVYLLLILFVTAGCQKDNSDQKLASKLDDLQQQIKNISEKQQRDADNLNKYVNQLYTNFLLEKNDTAYFTPSSQGYAVLKSNVGYFLVSLVKLVKYADGYKAEFNIGNPNYMLFQGVKASVQWGPAYSPDKNYGVWRDSLKLQEVNITKPLLPGMWNKITVILSPATANDTGYISLSMQADQILLSPDHRK